MPCTPRTRATQNQKQVRSGGKEVQSYLIPQGIHAPRVVYDYDRVIIPENCQVVLLDPSLNEFCGESIRGRWVDGVGIR